MYYIFNNASSYPLGTELLLRKEEESRKVGERQLQEERRRAQNTTELDQMRIRLRHQESIDEKNRTVHF